MRGRFLRIERKIFKYKGMKTNYESQVRRVRSEGTALHSRMAVETSAMASNSGRVQRAAAPNETQSHFTSTSAFAPPLGDHYSAHQQAVALHPSAQNSYGNARLPSMAALVPHVIPSYPLGFAGQPRTATATHLSPLAVEFAMPRATSMAPPVIASTPQRAAPTRCEVGNSGQASRMAPLGNPVATPAAQRPVFGMGNFGGNFATNNTTGRRAPGQERVGYLVNLTPTEMSAHFSQMSPGIRMEVDPQTGSPWGVYNTPMPTGAYAPYGHNVGPA